MHAGSISNSKQKNARLLQRGDVHEQSTNFNMTNINKRPVDHTTHLSNDSHASLFQTANCTRFIVHLALQNLIQFKNLNFSDLLCDTRGQIKI